MSASKLPDADGPLIRVTGLKKVYTVGGSPVKALDGVDLAVKRGEFLCLAGRSGSGKSTMLNMIAGLEPPTAGEILIEGRHVERMREEQRTRFRRKHIGFVFQSYNNLPQFTALENVALPLTIRGMGRSERTRLAKEALIRVGLGDHMRHKPSQLSGGQQQRVSIARAIVKKPKLIFADEPTAALDYRTSIEVLEVFEEIVRSRNTTVIMITHNPEIGRMAHRVIRIRDGRIANIKTNRQPARARELSW